MKTRVVTLMWGTAFERYGEDFVRGFLKFWPTEVGLTIVTDQVLPVPGRINQVQLADIPGYETFKARWGGDKLANGYAPPPGTKVNEHGYSWKHDAVKWMPQGLAPVAAIDGLAEGDILLWLDADVETHAAVPRDWPDRLLDGHDVACIQRPGVHSEIGIHVARISAATRALIERFANLYRTDAVFRLEETHSAYVYDRALEADPGLRIRNLGDGGKGHVWPRVPLLANYTMHHKGKRKDRRQ